MKRQVRVRVRVRVRLRVRVRVRVRFTTEPDEDREDDGMGERGQKNHRNQERKQILELPSRSNEKSK